MQVPTSVATKRADHVTSTNVNYEAQREVRDRHVGLDQGRLELSSIEVEVLCDFVGAVQKCIALFFCSSVH